MNESTKQNILLASAAVCAVALVGMFANQLVYKAPAAPIAVQQASQPNVVVQPLVVLPASESSEGEVLGGRIHNTQESFDEGIAVDGTEVISGTGAISATTLAGTTSLTIGSGTAIDKHVRTTASINVDSMAAQAGTSSAITLTGASSGDHCSATVTAGDYQSTTSTGRLGCRISATDVATLHFNNAASNTFDAGMSTFSIQAWSY